jgi:hypothetical protein
VINGLHLSGMITTVTLRLGGGLVDGDGPGDAARESEALTA